MKLSEAIAALEAGKKVRRPHWGEDRYYEKSAVRDHLEYVCIEDQTGDTVEDLVVSEDWELYEEPGHDFQWALEQLKAGKSITRKGWGQVSLNRDCLAGHIKAGVMFADMIATDWELA